MTCSPAFFRVGVLAKNIIKCLEVGRVRYGPLPVTITVTMKSVKNYNNFSRQDPPLFKVVIQGSKEMLLSGLR